MSVCSIRSKHYDDTTVFTGGEHSCIRHPSYVRYRDARLDHEADMQRAIDNGYFEISDPCDKSILELVRGGLQVSRFSQPYTRAFIDEAD